MHIQRVVAISGSHGKTTTSGMLVWALKQVGFSFSHMVGGRFAKDVLPLGSASDKSSWLILELDESDGTIGEFCPEITTALNCDLDHVDHYESRESLENAFVGLFERTSGTILVPEGSRLQALAEQVNGEKIGLYPRHENPADFLIANREAAIATASAMGADISKVNFDEFPGMGDNRFSLTLMD